MKSKASISFMMLCLLVFPFDGNSQSRKKVIYKAVLTTNLQQKAMKGILLDVKDSSLVIT